jgi:hypothetical protein
MRIPATRCIAPLRAADATHHPMLPQREMNPLRASSSTIQPAKRNLLARHWLHKHAVNVTPSTCRSEWLPRVSHDYENAGPSIPRPIEMPGRMCRHAGMRLHEHESPVEEPPTNCHHWSPTCSTDGKCGASDGFMAAGWSHLAENPMASPFCASAASRSGDEFLEREMFANVGSEAGSFMRRPDAGFRHAMTG